MLLEWKMLLLQYVLMSFRPKISVCSQKLRKTSKRELVSWSLQFKVRSHLSAFMIGKMLFSNIFLIYADLNMNFNDCKVDQSPWKRINSSLTNYHRSLSQRERFTRGVSQVEKWKFSNFNIFIRIHIVWIENLFSLGEWKKVDKLIGESYIEIDRSEAEKYELARELASFHFFVSDLIDRDRHYWCGAVAMLNPVHLPPRGT